MTESLIMKLTEYFAEQEFEKIPTDSQAVRMFGTFVNNQLYLINLIHLEDGYEYDHDRYLEYKQMTMAQFLKPEISRVVLLNLILTPSPAAYMDALNYTPDLIERFIDVTWLIDLESEILVVPPKQIKRVLGLEKGIRKLLSNDLLVKKKRILVERSAKPIITYSLVVMNVMMWLLLEVMGGSKDYGTLLRFGAMSGSRIASGEYYRLFTAMFLHIGFMHLFYNMFSLYIFGYRLERFISPLKYVFIYIGAGLMGSLSSYLWNLSWGREVLAAGASGAVYGIMGGLFVVALVRKRPIDGVSTYVLWLLFVMGIVFATVTPGIDMIAHIGGFVGGILLTALNLFWINNQEQA